MRSRVQILARNLASLTESFHVLVLVFPCQTGFRSHFKPLVLIVAIKIGCTHTRAKIRVILSKTVRIIFSAARRRNAFGNMHTRRPSAVHYITLLTKITDVSPEELYAATELAAILLSYYFEIRRVKIRHFLKES
jgi:hypothetical protein